MRRRRPERRQILPDPVYNDKLVAKFVNYIPRWLPLLRNWTFVRAAPFFAKKNLHQLALEEGVSFE